MKAPKAELKGVRDGTEWIGERIHELRQLRGLTQQQLGNLAGGIAGSRIGDMEHSRHDIKVSTLLRLCKHLGISPSEFFEGCPSIADKKSKSA